MGHHEAIDALPESGNKDPTILRNFLVKRVTYNFADDEDPTTWDALDGDTGSLPLALAFGGTHFFLDPDDTTSVHDGVTVVVTGDSYRYKASGVDYVVKSVLDKDLTAPPGSPALGDAYIVAAAATGAWAGHDDDMAIYTARGWRFAVPKIGQIVLVEDEDSFYRWTAAGAWTVGFGDQVLSANSVLSSMVLGGRSHWTIENQTTNAPPGSPADGVTYIIGGSPTGAWAGNAAKIAQAKNNAWLIYTPLEGWTAYDKANNVTYVYTGSAWAQQSLGYTKIQDAVNTASSALSRSGAAGNDPGYTYSATTAPTASQSSRWEETLTLTVQADYAGQIVDIDYQCAVDFAPTLSGTVTAGTLTVGCFIDSEANARDWVRVMASATANAWGTSPAAADVSIRLLVKLINIKMRLTLADTSSHTLKIILYPGMSGSGANFTGGTVTVSRRFVIAKYRV